MADDDRHEVRPHQIELWGWGARLALIVEGAAPISAVLADSLTALGWRTVVARGPEEARRLAAEHAFDMLVADAALGAVSGETLAAGLIKHRARPVVLVSDLRGPGGIEVWPPASFMPTVHSLDTLFSAISSLFDFGDAPAR